MSLSSTYRSLLVLATGLLGSALFLFAFGHINNKDPVAWSLLILNGTFAVCMLAIGLARNPLGFFSIFFYFIAFFYVIIPAIWLITDEWPYASTYQSYPGGIFSYAQLCVFLASIGFAGSYFSTRSRPSEAVSSGIKRGAWTLRRHHFFYLLIYLSMLLAGYILFGGSVVDAAFRSETLEGAGVGELGATKQRIAGDLLGLLRRAALFSSILLYLEYKRCGELRGKKRAAWVLVAALGLGLNLPMSVPRGWLLAVVFVLMALFVSNKSYRALAFSFVMIFGLYVSSVIDIFKREYWITRDSLAFDRSYFLQGHFQSFDTFMSQILVAGQRGFDFGLNSIGMIFMHVPRSLWSGKPLSPSLQLASEYYYQNFNWYHNVGASSVGSFYLDFGVLGVVLFGVLLGFLSRRLDPMLATTRGGYLKCEATQIFPMGAGLTLLPFCVGGSIVFLRGSSWVGYNFFLTSIVSFLFIWVILFRRVDGVRKHR